MTARNRSKFSVLPLIHDHYRTLRNASTGRTSVADLVLFLGIPFAAAGTTWINGARAERLGEVLAASAVLTGLIFNVFVLLFDLTMRAADRTDPAHLPRMNELADELRANVSYAVLVGIVLTALLGWFVMFGDEHQPLGRLPTAIVVFGGVQLLLTIFMVLKRVRALYRAFRVTQREHIP